MYKIAKIIAIILGVIGLVLWIMIARSDDNEGIVDIMLRLGEVLTYITVGITLLFSIIGLASDPDKLKKALISIVVFGVVLLIGYFLATGTDVDLQKMADRDIQVTEGTVKTVGAGLISFYILTVLAILAMVVGAFKKQ